MINDESTMLLSLINTTVLSKFQQQSLKNIQNYETVKLKLFPKIPLLSKMLMGTTSGAASGALPSTSSIPVGVPVEADPISAVPLATLEARQTEYKHISSILDNKSNIGYYIVVDLYLYPGTHIPVTKRATLSCGVQYERIKKEFAEVSGNRYVMPPMNIYPSRDKNKAKNMETKKNKKNKKGGRKTKKNKKRW